MAGVPSYRKLAEKTVGQAAAELNDLPPGRVATDVIMAKSARAQAIAAVAMAQALLEIGDVLRESLTRGDA